MNIEQLNEIVTLAGDGYSERKIIKDKKAYIPKREDPKDKNSALLPINDEVLDAHLDSTQPIGINLNVGDQKSHFGVFDFDDHAGEHEAQVMRVRVGFVAAALTNARVPYFVVRSGGGNGYHIWLTFAQAKRADTIRKLMRDYLDTANKLLSGGWPHEKFLPDDAEGKGMFVQTGRLHSRAERPDKSDTFHTEHYIELLPKNGDMPIVALPLSMESIVLTPTEIHDSGFMQFEDGGELAIKKITKAKPGPKGQQQSGAAVDEEAAFQGYMKAFPGGSYALWVKAAFHICGAFGEQGRDMFMTYSKATDGFETEQAVTKKWDEIAKNCSPNGDAFWAYARAGGYKGGFPDDVKLAKADTPRIILEDIVGSVEPFQDRDGIAFARVSTRRVMRVDSQEFADYVRRTAYAAGVTPSSEMIKAMQDLARAHSYDDRENVHLRVAKVDDAIYVDMCDKDDSVMKITAEELRVRRGDEKCPVAFRRSGQQPLEYDESGTIDDIRALVNIDNDQFVIFMACAVKMFFPDTPSPIVNITGEYGAAKTSATWVMRSLLDPVMAMTTPYSGKIDDPILRSWHNAVVTLENMTKLTDISDTLCGICTGMGFETRQLYTNSDLFTIFVKRPVIVNGIDPAKYASDLISRMVEIELRVAERKMSETAFVQKLENSAPKMFFAMINLVHLVLKELQSIDVEEYAQRNIRLASFAAVGEATARVLGKEPDWFANTMEARQYDAQLDAAMDNVVFVAMGVWGTDMGNDEIRISPQRLLRDLRNIALEHDLGVQRLPLTASTLSREMKSVAPMLRKHGWSVDKKSRDWWFNVPSPTDAFEAMVEDTKHLNEGEAPF